MPVQILKIQSFNFLQETSQRLGCWAKGENDDIFNSKDRANKLKRDTNKFYFELWKHDTQALNEASFPDSGAFSFPRTSRPLSVPTFACQVGQFLNHHENNNNDAAENVDDNAAGDFPSPPLPVKSVSFWKLVPRDYEDNGDNGDGLRVVVLVNYIFNNIL